MGNCPYCNTPLEKGLNFCINCEKQVKCISCGSSLFANKSKCLACGQPLHIDSSGLMMNEFTLEESQTKNSSNRSVKGKFSDSAFANVALFLSKNIPSPVQKPAIKKIADGQMSLLQDTSADVKDDHESISTQDDISGNTNNPVETELKNYFTQNGKGSIAPRTIDFKGKTKKDQQIRFMLLFVAAYRLLLGKAVPDTKTILDALEEKKMMDSNAPHYFAFVENSFLTKINDGYELSLDGDKELSKLLNEIKTSDSSGFTAWGQPGKPRGKYHKIDSETERNLNEWVDMDPKIGNFDIRTLKSPTKYALFGTYLITSLLAVKKTISYGMVYEYLVRKFSSIPVSKDALRKAFSAPTNASRFQKSSNGEFYLTPTAENEVKKWLEKSVGQGPENEFNEESK